MSDLWSSAYLRTEDHEAVVSALQRAAEEAGYRAFNPFSGVPGRAYPQSVRLFVSPAQGGWVRVVGLPEPALLAAASQLSPLLMASLNGEQAKAVAWTGGEPGTLEAIFGQSMPDAPTGKFSPASSAPESALLAALPEDVKAMNVHPKQAQAMISKLSAGLLRKAGGDQASAMAMLQGNPPNWESSNGRRLAALFVALGIPGWKEPDFAALRDAYQLLIRRKTRPQSPLYPGDQEVMDAVPNALEYRPVYAGKG
jgi:hypothetical protein